MDISLFQQKPLQVDEVLYFGQNLCHLPALKEGGGPNSRSNSRPN